MVTEFCSLPSSPKSPHHPSAWGHSSKDAAVPRPRCPAVLPLSLLCSGVLAKAEAPWAAQEPSAARLLSGPCLENALMRISPQSCSANEKVPEALEWLVPAQNPGREPDLGAFLSPCDSELA